jgi:hypothetical protein
VTPRLCLIVLGHRTILLPVCPRAKCKCHVLFSFRAYFPANRTYLPAGTWGKVGVRQDCPRHACGGERTRLEMFQ